MSLQFFADHCISRAIIQSLEEGRHKVFCLKNHIPADSPDEVVISKAQELDAVLISLNGDFADIVRYPPERYRGIIALQVRNHPEAIPSLLAGLKVYLAEHPDIEYYKGKLFLVEVHRIRVRK